jgi:hypothetical protein
MILVLTYLLTYVRTFVLTKSVSNYFKNDKLHHKTIEKYTQERLLN